MNGSLIAVVVGFVLVAFVWFWTVHREARNHLLALSVVVAVFATVVDLVIPVPSVEVLSSLVVICACRIGVRAAATMALVGIIAAGIVGGLGVWTLWQCVALVAGMAVARAIYGLGSVARMPEGAALTVATAGCVVVADLVNTVSGLITAAVVSPESVPVVLLAGIPFTLVHIMASGITTAFIWQPVSTAFSRVAVRVAYDT